MKARRFLLAILVSSLAQLLAVSCALTDAATAEEYFSLGSAYLDLGKYPEAERWFQKARAADNTRNASEYNLGRIAFELGRAEEAVRIFESLLEKDAGNATLLRAAAYARIKNGDYERAVELYERAALLLPETEDSGYNFALVLYATGRHDRAAEILAKILEADSGDREALLLLARAQKALGRPEAIDSYEAWLAGKDDAVVRGELAGACEAGGFFAKAVENYDAILKSGKASSPPFKGGEILFSKARALLIADPANPDALGSLTAALKEGFADEEALAALVEDGRIADREAVRAAIEEAKPKPETAVAGSADGTTETEGSSPAPVNADAGTKE